MEHGKRRQVLENSDKISKSQNSGIDIANDISNMTVLETLELRGNTLGVDATYPIAKALESRPELRRALWSDLFTGRLKEEIPQTLVNLFENDFQCRFF